MNALVLGGNGFIGSHLVDALLHEDIGVTDLAVTCVKGIACFSKSLQGIFEATK